MSVFFQTNQTLDIPVNVSKVALTAKTLSKSLLLLTSGLLITTVQIAQAATSVTTTSSTTSTYRVKQGETLNGIANRLGIPASQLASENRKLPTDKLHIDEVLFVTNKPKVQTIISSKPMVAKPPVAKAVTVAKTGTVTPAKTTATSSIKNPFYDTKQKVNVLKVTETSVVKKTAIAPSVPSKPLKTSIYTVVAGDTLSGLAKTYDISVAQLQQLNPTLMSQQLTIGQKLNVPLIATAQAKPVAPTNMTPKTQAVKPAVAVPAPAIRIETYKVTEGDTLSSLASRYNLSVNDIAKINQILPDAMIKTGQTLMIPVNSQPEKTEIKY